MAGSILRLTIFVLLTSLYSSTLLLRPVSFIQNPFDLMGILRKEIRDRGAGMFHYSPKSTIITFNPRIRAGYHRKQRGFRIDPLMSSSYTRVALQKAESNYIPEKNRRNHDTYFHGMKNTNTSSVTMKDSNSSSFSISIPLKKKNKYTLLSANNIAKKQSAAKDYTNTIRYEDKNQTSLNYKNKYYYILTSNYSEWQEVASQDTAYPTEMTASYKDKQSINKTLDNDISKIKHDYLNNVEAMGKPNFEMNSSSSYYQREPPHQESATSFSQPEDEENKPKSSFLGYVINTLTQLPVIGNVLRASVDPLYRPIVRGLKADNETLMRGESNMKNWCFDELGCIKPSIDFYHPLYRPVNLPPYSREQISTKFTLYTRNQSEGVGIPAVEIQKFITTTFSPLRLTKIIIHGYLNYRGETWILEMVRGFLKHGDYNVITVDWSGGAYALYSQATANIRVVALEVSRLLSWLEGSYGLDMLTVHIVGHSLGAHTAGYVGERIKSIARITGLDPAEPYFQYMPPSVRLDPTDAHFVDVIHTDINPFFALTGPRGFGLRQAVGHVDFYPNGGREQPGCNQLLTRLPMTLILEGRDFIEGINAAHTELLNCDHVRSTKLFTDSLTSGCPYLGYVCSNYEDYKEGKCFDCGPMGEFCAFMGINADTFQTTNRTNVKVFLDTLYAPNFCKYHYILTIEFADPVTSLGSLRGRLKISLIDENGELKKFDLTALSPIKFPRRGSKTFLLEHYEDLSGTQEALINWIYESDLLNPLSYCVLFCKADLSISSISLTSVDSSVAANEVLELHSGMQRTYMPFYKHEVVMCQSKGEHIIQIPTESTVKVSASSACRRQRNVIPFSSENLDFGISNLYHEITDSKALKLDERLQ